MRESAAIQAEIDSKKAAGVHPASREMVALRAELRALDGAGSEPAPMPPLRDAAAKAAGACSDSALASNDLTFINEALAQLVLKGGAGKPEKAYSDIRSVLAVKHLIEDAAGLAPSGRIALPHWDTLGRERDTGMPFKPGENQLVVDGLAQRAVPAPKVAPSSRPTITAPDGSPIRLPRSKLDEPEGAASFVTSGSVE
jgi:hypothetical protein